MNSSSSLRVEGERKYTINSQFPTPKAAIIKLLNLIAGDTSLASDFSQVWVLREFQLGDELTSYGLDGETGESENFLYLVCQGRVRLLAFDATAGREVSTQLLLAEQIFGADHLFSTQPLPYRAIASSAGVVAQISLAALKLWLQRLPNLENYLIQLALERQALIFFKSYSELRSLPSLTIKQLLPYILESKITAGSSLVEAAPPTTGRFWLARGKIQKSPLLAETWGYPDVTPIEGIAATELSVYHLPIEHWESATALAPQLFTHKLQPIREEKFENNWQTSSNPVSQVIEPLPNHPQTDSIQDIDFPQRPPRDRFWSPYPFIQQQSSSDCGAACLAMISQYWGKRLSLNSLRNLAGVDRMGASLQGLATAAQTLGYDVLPVRASLGRLDLYSNPWVAHWQGIHYLVVWRVKGDGRILIADPARGKRWLSRSEFETGWTGYALLLNPTERFDALQSEEVSLNRYWQLFQTHRQLLQQIILASVLGSVLGLATPLFTQIILDRVIPLQSFVPLNIFAVGFLILGIWRIALTAGRQFLLDYFANHIDLSLMSGFISHTLQLPLQFFASRQVEDIISRIQENRKIQMFLSRQVLGAALDAVMVVIFLGLMVYYNWQLTLLVLGWILPIVLLTLGVSPFLKKVSQEISLSSAQQNSSVVEMITGVATVKTAGAEVPMQHRWQERFMSMVQLRLRGQKLANKLQLANRLFLHLGNTMVLWFGASLVMGGEMSLGQFVAFNLLTSNVVNPVLALVELGNELPEVLISLERLNDVLDSVPEENPQKALPPIRGEVRFENVSFRYNADEDRNTLQNITFKVKPRQTIGIVGESGCGKSTVVNLLAGLYRPHTGRILIDGHDIADVSPQSLRSQLSLVSQECFLFSGTILDNITLYSAEFTLEGAIASAKLAEAHTFIEALPLGYNTPVGNSGFQLSSGQKQKIAIARALIRNPGILILDEATSALDADSERSFQENLTRISLYRTTFIISQRLSAVYHADCILVLNRGIVVEQGTHQELIAIGGFYSHLAQQQLPL